MTDRRTCCPHSLQPRWRHTATRQPHISVFQQLGYVKNLLTFSFRHVLPDTFNGSLAISLNITDLPLTQTFTM